MRWVVISLFAFRAGTASCLPTRSETGVPDDRRSKRSSIALLRTESTVMQTTQSPAFPTGHRDTFSRTWPASHAAEVSALWPADHTSDVSPAWAPHSPRQRRID